MQAAKFFEQNADKAGECFATPTVEARKIKKGERVVINVGFNVQTTVDHDGWQIVGQNGYEFVTDTELQQNYKPVTQAASNDLPEGAKVEPVKKGQIIVTQPWDDTTLGVQTKSVSDGFLVTLPENGKPRFMSDSAFRAAFKTNAALPENADEQGIFQRIPQEDDKPVRYVMLDQEVSFDFKKGAYIAPAGSVLFENEEDEDGFTVVPADYFAKNFTVANTSAPALQAPAPSI